jgi:hypothetical protein
MSAGGPEGSEVSAAGKPTAEELWLPEKYPGTGRNPSVRRPRDTGRGAAGGAVAEVPERLRIRKCVKE